MRKYLMSIYVVLFLIGATALWYFGHHRPAQKILEAEPNRVYKTTSVEPADLSVKPTSSDAIQESREDNTDIDPENTDPAVTPEKLDNNRDRAEVTDVDELVLQEDLSVDDPAAAEAFEKYVKTEADYQAVQEKLKIVLKTSISNSKALAEALAASDLEAALEIFDNNNRDQLLSIAKALTDAKSRRDEALENLAVYSEDAAEMLAQIKESERRTGTVFEHDPEIRELEAEARELEEMLEEFRPE